MADNDDVPLIVDNFHNFAAIASDHDDVPVILSEMF